ncbi:MAG: hypothetical protein ACRCUD_03265 [Cetobacterium sp.]
MKKILAIGMLIFFIGCGKEENKPIKTVESKAVKELKARDNGAKYEESVISLEEYLNLEGVMLESYLKSELKDWTESDLELLAILGLTNPEKWEEILKPVRKIVANEKYLNRKWQMKDNQILVEGDNIKTILFVEKDEKGNVKILNKKNYKKNGDSLNMNPVSAQIINGFLGSNVNVKEGLLGTKENRIDRFFSWDNQNNKIVLRKITKYKNDKKQGEALTYGIYDEIIKKEIYDKDILQEVILYNDRNEIQRKETYKDGKFDSLLKYVDNDLILEVVPSKQIYKSYNNKKQVGFIDVLSGTYEEIIGNKKIIGNPVSKFTVNETWRVPNRFDSLEEFYMGMINGVIKIQGYSNEKLILEKYYKNYESIMEHKEWYENGKSKKYGKFSNGRPTSVWKEWSEDGILIEVRDYGSGYETSKVEKYYNNGKIHKQYSINNRDGYMVGSFLEFYENGKIKLEGVYGNESLKAREWDEFNSNGDLIKRTKYSYGDIRSIEEYDLKNKIVRVIVGNIVREFKFEKSRYGGYNEEKPLKKYVEIKGIKNGEYIEYYSNEKYYPNRYSKVVGNYKDDLKDGEWKFYDKANDYQGELSNTIFYVDGKDVNSLSEEENSDYDEALFYPSGRIKSISYGPEEYSYDDTDIDLKALKSEVNNLSKEVVNFKISADDNGESFGWQIADLDIKIKGLSLSKNLTTEEREELKKLMNMLNITHKKAQDIWNN